MKDFVSEALAHSFIVEALSQYGATLSKNGYIVTEDGKVTQVRIVIKRGRVRMESVGALLFSGPPTAETVCKFVERYWYWTKK